LDEVDEKWILLIFHPGYDAAMPKYQDMGASSVGDAARISKRLIIDELNIAEGEFRWCWDLVAACLDLGLTQDDGSKIRDFQLRLFDALARLEDIHHSLRAEEKRLIARKLSLSEAWFAARMKTLAKYREAVLHGVAIGRAIGDAFAWFFYQFDRELIEEHRAHQRQPFLPMGIGRAGERAVIKEMQGQNGRLLIHHGTTTFLRMGDISYIDLPRMRVASVGEVKARRHGDHLKVSVNLVSSREDMLPQIPEDAVIVDRLDMSRAVADKLARQSDLMAKAIENSQKTKARRLIEAEMRYHYSAVPELVAKSNCRQFEFVKLGAPAVLGSVKLPRRSFGGRIFGDGTDMHRASESVPHWALQIMVDNCDYNALRICKIAGDPKGLEQHFEQPPFLHWPIDTRTKEAILFARVALVALYNPAHFWRALEERGFELSWRSDGRELLDAVRRDGDQAFHFQSADWFHHLMSHEMMDLELVLEMLDTFFEQAGELGSDVEPGKPRKIEIYPRFGLVRPMGSGDEVTVAVADRENSAVA